MKGSKSAKNSTISHCSHHLDIGYSKGQTHSHELDDLIIDRKQHAERHQKLYDSRKNIKGIFRGELKKGQGTGKKADKDREIENSDKELLKQKENK